MQLQRRTKAVGLLAAALVAMFVVGCAGTGSPTCAIDVAWSTSGAAAPPTDAESKAAAEAAAEAAGESGTGAPTSSSTSTTTNSTTTVSEPRFTIPEPPPQVPGDLVLRDTFDRPDGLITNEYATWNPGASDCVEDNVWWMNSGSVFARSGTAWTGTVDDRTPDSASSNGTGSAVFRMLSHRSKMADVVVSFRLRFEGMFTTPSTPAVDWDGVHVLLRYASEQSLYYASVNRRDGTTQIKKKVPGGPSNDGTYYTLASGWFAFVPWQWQDVRATITTQSDGSVRIVLSVDSNVVCQAIDRGVGGPVVPSGMVGIRGDNTMFSVDDFEVRLA